MCTAKIASSAGYAATHPFDFSAKGIRANADPAGLFSAPDVPEASTIPRPPKPASVATPGVMRARQRAYQTRGQGRQSTILTTAATRDGDTTPVKTLLGS